MITPWCAMTQYLDATTYYFSVQSTTTMQFWFCCQFSEIKWPAKFHYFSWTLKKTGLIQSKAKFGQMKAGAGWIMRIRTFVLKFFWKISHIRDINHTPPSFVKWSIQINSVVWWTISIVSRNSFTLKAVTIVHSGFSTGLIDFGVLNIPFMSWN